MSVLSKLPIVQDIIPVPVSELGTFPEGHWGFVIAHSTGNPNDSVDGEVNYEKNTWQNAFVHYFCGAKKIVQTGRLEYPAWGAGHTANKYALHVEAVEGEPFSQVYPNYVALIAGLLFDAGKPVVDGVTLYSHAETSAKWHETDHTDPLAWLSKGLGIANQQQAWNHFVADVKAKWNSYKIQPAPPKPATPLPVVYRVSVNNVQKGAFAVLANAQSLAKQLESQGNKVVIKKSTDGSVVYSTPVPTITVSKPVQAVTPPKAPTTTQAPVHEGGTVLILHPTTAKQEQVVAWLKSKGASDFLVNAVSDYFDLAPKYGVRPEVAISQSAKETNFGHFGGVLNPTFNNFCGLKTTQGGDNYDPNAHMKFPDQRTGVLAHIQHLSLYSGASEVEGIAVVDPRHFSSVKGTAKFVEELGGRWAPDVNYGVSIVNDYLTSLLATPVPVVKQPTTIIPSAETTYVTVDKADVVQAPSDGEQAVSFLSKLIAILKKIFRLN